MNLALIIPHLFTSYVTLVWIGVLFNWFICTHSDHTTFCSAHNNKTILAKQEIAYQFYPDQYIKSYCMSSVNNCNSDIV